MKIEDLSLWQAFAMTAKYNSFSKAAKALQTTPPNLSKKVSKLEDALSMRLFQRTTRLVRLTSDGEKLLPYAVSLVEDARNLEERAFSAKDLSGTIRMTSLMTVALRWLPQVIAEFRKKYPEIEFQVEATDRLVDLVEEQMDLGIRVAEPRGADFVYRELAVNELVICASPSYVSSHSPIKKPKDLHAHSLLTLDVFRNCKFGKTGEKLSEFEGARQYKIENGIILTELARSGAGVAVRSKWDVLPFLKNGDLVSLLDHSPLEPFGKVYLTVPHRRYLNPRVKLFADFVLSLGHTLNGTKPKSTHTLER